MHPVNVLFLIYDLERGGPELRLLDFAERFPADIRMHICVLSENLSLLGSFEELGCPVIVVPVSRAYLEPNKIWTIYRYVRFNRIEVLNSFDMKSLLISTIVRCLFRAKVTLIHHFVELLDDTSSLQRKLLRVFLECTDFSVFNSEYTRNSILKMHFPVIKNVKIHNGVDIGRFKARDIGSSFLKEIHGIDTDCTVMGTIANFRTEKNYPFLLKAFALLSKNSSHLRLICVGGGYLLDEIKQIAKECGMEKRIIFSGYSEKNC